MTACASCPFPLVVPEDLTSTEGVVAACCAVPCLGTMSTEEDIESYNSILLALTTLGLIAGLFMVVTWGLFAAKERQKVTFWLGVCGVNVTFPLWLGAISTSGTSSDYWCKTNNEAFKQSDGGLCVYQGVTLVYFALAACSWWFVSCVDLFSKLVLGKRNIEHYLTYYHIYCWGLPAFCTIVLLGLETFGYFAPRLWCFMVDGSKIPEWVLFNTPMTTMWIVGTILMISVIVVLLRRIGQVEGAGSDPKKYLRYLILYKQPLIFVFAMSFIWLIFVTLAFVILVDEDDLRESAESWVLCLLFNAANNIIDPARNASADRSLLVGTPSSDVGCGVIQPSPVGKGLLTLATVTLASVSIIIFLVFGIHKENYILWRDLICPRDQEPEKSTNKFETRQTSETFTSDVDYGKASAAEKKRPELSNRAQIVIEFVSSFWIRLRGKQSSGSLESLGMQEEYGEAPEHSPRYMYTPEAKAPERQKPRQYTKQDVDNLAYEDWEKQFFADPLWGIQ